MSQAKYFVGVDLGTTHCAVSYVAIEEGNDPSVFQLSIPQLVAPGQIAERELLPSFIYTPHESEVTPDEMMLPWEMEDPVALGEMAREKGALTPTRLVSSAKSWLCHENVDKRSGILPYNAPEGVDKFSPLQATIYYLEHMREAWDYHFPDAPLFQQEIVLTVPASFDPSARELTAEAAMLSDFENVTLLEEPQAAFYNWLYTQKTWKETVEVGDVILVVDVGGGTTDFSLIAVTEAEGALQMQRIAVGDHILVGGDNMDLALAYCVNAKLIARGERLDKWQIQAMTHGCRQAKETLLNDASIPEATVVVPGRSSKLIGGSLSETITQEELEQIILKGFLPEVHVTDPVLQRAKIGLTQVGLEYAHDAGITRHLGSFLSQQKQSAEKIDCVETKGHNFIHPTKILFNGGVFKSERLREKLLNVINGWLADDQGEAVGLLKTENFDLAVSKGAAYFSKVKQTNGLRIKGGTAQAYYIGVDSGLPAIPGFEPPLDALCVASFGMEAGSRVDMPEQTFGLVVGESVKFRFFGSTVRREDKIGEIFSNWSDEELHELESIEMALAREGRKKGEVVPVYLRSSQTEIGTLLLEAVSTDNKHSWKLEFDVRG